MSAIALNFTNYVEIGAIFMRLAGLIREHPAISGHLKVPICSLSLGHGRTTAEYGWGGRIRTCECRYQKPVPYRLATPQHGQPLIGAMRAGRLIAAARGLKSRNQALRRRVWRFVAGSSLGRTGRPKWNPCNWSQPSCRMTSA
jgi:hypothetical protein